MRSRYQPVTLLVAYPGIVELEVATTYAIMLSACNFACCVSRYSRTGGIVELEVATTYEIMISACNFACCVSRYSKTGGIVKLEVATTDAIMISACNFACCYHDQDISILLCYKIRGNHI